MTRIAATGPTLSLLLGLVGGGAWAAEALNNSEISEVELLRRYLNAPVIDAALEAEDARAAASARGPALLSNPSLTARHEDANGPAGFSTDTIGGRMTVDLGFSAVGEVRAAALRGQAGPHWRDAALLDAACTFRGELLELWGAQEHAVAAATAHDRLSALEETLVALDEAGESSLFDRERALLALTAHHAVADGELGELVAARARVAALTGASVATLLLADPTPLAELDAYRQRVAQHPELVALRLERDAAARDAAAARRAVLPDLQVNASARWDALPDADPVPGFEIGGALELPVFDWSRAETADADSRHAALEALVLRREAELAAGIEGAWQRTSSLAPTRDLPDAERLWDIARERYARGEGDLSELLVLAEEVEAATLAGVEHALLRRRAHLDLVCAAGAFDDPALQAVVEERQ